MSLTICSEASAQAQYPYDQDGAYSGQQAQYQSQPRRRILSLNLASVRLMGGGVIVPGAEGDDYARGLATVVGGPVFDFVGTSYDVTFAFVPEVGYSLFVNSEGDEQYAYGHLAVIGARIGFVVEVSYLEEIFGLDLFARVLLGGDDHRFAFAAHAGLTLALINHLFVFEAGYQWFSRFDGGRPHSIVLTGGLDIPRCILSFTEEIRRTRR